MSRCKKETRKERFGHVGVASDWICASSITCHKRNPPHDFACNKWLQSSMDAQSLKSAKVESSGGTVAACGVGHVKQEVYRWGEV